MQILRKLPKSTVLRREICPSLRRENRDNLRFRGSRFWQAKPHFFLLKMACGLDGYGNDTGIAETGYDATTLGG